MALSSLITRDGILHAYCYTLHIMTTVSLLPQSRYIRLCVTYTKSTLRLYLQEERQHLKQKWTENFSQIDIQTLYIF